MDVLDAIGDAAGTSVGVFDLDVPGMRAALVRDLEGDAVDGVVGPGRGLVNAHELLEDQWAVCCRREEHGAVTAPRDKEDVGAHVSDVLQAPVQSLKKP
jgi:hypothetical protein